jgi:general secretion pathway protein G
MRWLALVTGFIVGFVAVKYLLDLQRAADKMPAQSPTTVQAPVSNTPGPARRAQALTNMRELTSALEQFRIDTDRYPTTEEGLEGLRGAPKNLKGWRGPYVSKNIPPDPWGNDYEYESDGKSFTLFSYGADGIEGGEGDAEDLIESSG